LASRKRWSKRKCVRKRHGSDLIKCSASRGYRLVFNSN